MQDKLFELGIGLLFFIASFAINELRAKQRKRVMLGQLEVTRETSKAQSDQARDELDQKYQKYFFDTTTETSKLLIQLEQDRLRMVDERNRETMLKAQMSEQIGRMTSELEALKQKADTRHQELEIQAARESALNQTLLDVQAELQRCRDERDNLKGQ